MNKFIEVTALNAGRDTKYCLNIDTVVIFVTPANVERKKGNCVILLSDGKELYVQESYGKIKKMIMEI